MVIKESRDCSWQELRSKSVEDSDGFLTDYTLYYDADIDSYMCIFGDKELYNPDNTEPDWEGDDRSQADEWFDSYNTDYEDDFDWDDEDELDNPYDESYGVVPMIEILEGNHARGRNYLLTHSKNGVWKQDSENGVEYIVVNNLETVGADCQGLVTITDGINKEHTIYEWGIDGGFEKWTEIDSSNPDYEYLTQYLNNSFTESLDGTINISGERTYDGVHYYVLSTEFSVDDVSVVRSLESQLGFPVQQMGYSDLVWVQADEADLEDLQTAVNNFNGNSLSESYLKEDRYVDGTGVMGDVGETWTVADLRNYWEEEKDYDPELQDYDSFDSWVTDTIDLMEPIEDTIEPEEDWYIDTSGIVGDFGEAWTVSQLRDYWNAESEYDPVLQGYDSFDSWLSDTISQMELVEESLSIKEDHEVDDDYEYNSVSNELPADVDIFLMDFAQVYGGIDYSNIADLGAVWELLPEETTDAIYQTINQIEEACEDTGLDCYETAQEYGDVKDDCERLIQLVKGHEKV